MPNPKKQSMDLQTSIAAQKEDLVKQTLVAGKRKKKSALIATSDKRRRMFYHHNKMINLISGFILILLTARLAVYFYRF